MSVEQNTGVVRRMTSTFRRFGKSQSGVAAIEFAFIAPIMILGMFGAWEYSRVFATEQKVTKIAGSVADLVARSSDPNSSTGADGQATCAEIATLLQVTDVVMAPYDTTSLSVSIFNVRAKTDSKTNVEIKWKAHNGRGTAATEQKAKDFVTTGKLLVDKTNDEVVVVIVNYEHPFAITGLAAGDGATKINLSETTPMKPRIGPVRLTSAKNTNVAAGNSTTSGTVTCTSVAQRSTAPY